jgi:DNA-binding MarR family transcriptional regulator
MRLARRMRRERAADGLTLSQLAVLGTLDRRGPSSLGALAAEEKVTPPSITRVVKHLLAAGLVTRTAHESDGRQVVVELTPEAQQLLSEDRRRREVWLASRLRELDQDERAALARAAAVMEKVARA